MTLHVTSWWHVSLQHLYVCERMHRFQKITGIVNKPKSNDPWSNPETYYQCIFWNLCVKGAYMWKRLISIKIRFWLMSQEYLAADVMRWSGQHLKCDTYLHINHLGFMRESISAWNAAILPLLLNLIFTPNTLKTRNLHQDCSKLCKVR